MATSPFTNYDLATNVMKLSPLKAVLIWDTNGFANLAGFLRKLANITENKLKSTKG
jgi:hypothetical protein